MAFKVLRGGIHPKIPNKISALLKNLKSVERPAIIKAIAAAKSATPAQIAIAWVVTSGASRGATIVPLIGAHGWEGA